MKTETTKSVYCIFHYAPDKTPAWHGDDDLPITHATKQEALKEICDTLREHVRQIEEGHRDLEDGIGFEDWIEEVQLHPDGSITDKDGNTYGPRED